MHIAEGRHVSRIVNHRVLLGRSRIVREDGGLT